MLGEGLDARRGRVPRRVREPVPVQPEYRRMFGAPPRQDVAALKVEAQPTN